MVFGLYNVANYQIISMEDNYILSKIIQHDKKRFQLGCQMPCMICLNNCLVFEHYMLF